MTRTILLVPLLVGCLSHPDIVFPLPGPLEQDHEVFFSTQAPWDFPTTHHTVEVSKLSERARQDYRSVRPRVKLVSSGVFHDPQRHFLFLAFEIADDSPEYYTDFYLVYIFDQSVHRFIGRVHIPMA